MIFNLDTIEHFDDRLTFSLRCPSCRNIGSFTPLGKQGVKTIVDGQGFYFGQRICPNRACRAHLFLVFQHPDRIIITYPPERLDFDSLKIPTNIATTFDEAITCHANRAYIAAAIMVRRTLEELCENQAAPGKNLKDRIKALSGKVILPPQLLAGLDNLRLLGNDAAHIEATSFKEVGPIEVELAIDLTKEVLKSIFQLDSLIVRLEKLKK